MCLFFGNLVQECSHAECQIVATIRSLNQQNIFTDAGPPPPNAPQQTHPIPLTRMVQEQPFEQEFKVEDKGLPSIQIKPNEGPMNAEELYWGRVERLEREVFQLRNLVFWMKNKLQMQGILR